MRAGRFPVAAALARAALVVIAGALLLGPQGTAAAQFAVRERPSEAPIVPPDWPMHLERLREMMAGDAEYAAGLRRLATESGSDPVNCCLIRGVTCGPHGHMIALELRGVDAALTLAALPKTITNLTITQSTLRHAAPSLLLAALPAWVVSVVLRDVAFEGELGGRASLPPTPIDFGLPKQGSLQVFVCSRCGIGALRWEALPPLLALDLSQNPLRAEEGPSILLALPATLRLLNMSGCGLQWDAEDTTVRRHSSAVSIAFPPSIVVLDLSNNKISGSITTAWVLPPYLETLRLANNQIAGARIVEQLPPSLQHAELDHNALSGHLGDLSRLARLRTLDVSHNRIEDIDWAALPPGLVRLDAANNALGRGGGGGGRGGGGRGGGGSGGGGAGAGAGAAAAATADLPFELLPHSLRHFDVSSNALSGPLNISALPPALEHFDISGNAFSGPVDLTALSPLMRFFFINRNKFTGRPDVSRLPVDSRRIAIGDNSWDSLMPPLEDPLDEVPADEL